jgi:antitoxin ParD1/3/4
MHRQSINFTDPNAEWIKAELEASEYNSASELVNDLIRQRRQEEEAKIEAIRSLILEGIESGTTDLTPQQIKQQVRQRKQI